MRDLTQMLSAIAGITAAFMLLSLVPARARAVSSDELQEQIDALKAQNGAVQVQIEEVNAQYEQNGDEIADIIAQKNIIDQEINLLSAQTNNINSQITAYSVLIAQKQGELDEAETGYEALKEKYKLRVRAMEEEGRISYWQILFKANSFIELVDQLNMMEEIARADQLRIQELNDAAEAVKEAKEELEEGKAGLENAWQELALAQEELDAKRETADTLLQELIRRADELESLREELEAQKSDYLDQIAAKEEEYDAAKQAEWEAYLAAQEPNDTVATENDEVDPPRPDPSADAGWVVPCGYSCITSPFGNRNAPTAGASTNHKGVDLGAGRGTPVYASRAGIVTIASHNWSAGNHVQIDHQDGYKSIYMHLDSYCVSPGQVVSAGELIGVVGDSGNTTGCHLHFGISFNGEYVNPCSYVALY